MSSDYKFTVKKMFLHVGVVLKHKWEMFLLCCNAGIPFKGIVHDLSKFCLVEFVESVKYYQGFESPITHCTRVVGYSKAWEHHKKNNKHHYG